MKNAFRAAVGVITGIYLSFCLGSALYAQPSSKDSGAVKKEAVVTKRASGTFEVKLTPQPTADSAGEAKLGRMSIDKKFSGDLQAISKGEMLAAGTDVPGSAGYVAIERVSGKLSGRKGSFVLQHSGTMTRGAPHLVITVVPDSGTDELVGLSGKMEINIADGKHSYVFEYTLAH
jgi:hypothetical protein